MSEEVEQSAETSIDPEKAGKPEKPSSVQEEVDKPVEPEPQSEAPTIVKSDKTDPVIEEKTPEKVVYITFDDGPSKWTDQFLDVLQEHGVKATFFMQGSNLKNENLQKSVRRTVQEGHYIGGHSMTHNFKTLYTDKQFVPEMIETLDLIHEITGSTPHLVRPPYGSAPGLKNEEIRVQLVNAHIKVWDWTIDSQDWELAGNPSQIVRNIKQGTTSDREIVLMHEKPQTLEALPSILKFFKEQGYEFAVYEEEHHFTLNFQNDARL
ncbi:polysaccharide deacetylase family protein [Sporosarcina aquimarina]|uniref:Polysaccharide deacetylase family protein n=1 Tax=Sporosarcina aquimarina TaxID=114975 RepID=A0ABU4G153_9BACL|nr:polysaccharide deacetylase family protein [Sporosarcina aquimarina]MDW0110606.1 polysaccharide deacetylase family protein [Sporosarcina aquimarina]